MTGPAPLFRLDDALPSRPRVFGVGFHKTATTSLAHALYTLGYTVAGYFDTSEFEDQEAVLGYAIEVAELHNAAQDMPWPVLYRELDAAFPGSKFVLTLRDEDTWWKSVESHFGNDPIATHRLVYGVPFATGHEEEYRARYCSHNAEVCDYFSHRPGDLLTMRFDQGDGWALLCDFLGIELPTSDFPRQNVAPAAPFGIDRIARRLGRERRRVLGQRGGFPAVKVMWRRMQQHCARGDALFSLSASSSGRAQAVFEDSAVHFYGAQVEAMRALRVVDHRTSHATVPGVDDWTRLASASRHYIGNLHGDTWERRVGRRRVDVVLRSLHDLGIEIIDDAASALDEIGSGLDQGRLGREFPALIAGRPL